jgi:hypothetical protein
VHRAAVEVVAHAVGVPVVPKPFDPHLLLGTIAAVLGTSAG